MSPHIVVFAVSMYQSLLLQLLYILWYPAHEEVVNTDLIVHHYYYYYYCYNHRRHLYFLTPVCLVIPTHPEPHLLEERRDATSGTENVQ